MSRRPSRSGETPNFDRLATAYRWLEWFSFGPWLSWSRRAFIGKLTGCRRALVLGDGDGRFTAALLRTNPEVEVDAVDASPAMLQALVDRAGPHRPRVRTQTADARALRPAPDQHYDAVATHFFLDCLTTAEILTLAGAIRPSLAPGSVWLISEFSIPETSFGRLVAAPLVATLYRTFGLLTGLEVRRLPDHHQALNEAGFRLIERRPLFFGLLVSELWKCAKCPLQPTADHPGTRFQFTEPNITTVLKSIE